MWSSLNKHFTSDAMQSSGNVVKKFLEIKAKNFWISGFKRFLVSISWRYMIIVCFWVLTSPNMIQLCWNYCQRWYSSKQKHCFKYFWRIWVFIETRRTQNLHFWSTLDAPNPPFPPPPCAPLPAFLSDSHWTIQRYQNQSMLYLLSLFWEKYDYILH